MQKRDNAVATAADSIIVYNNWRETDEDHLLQEIADYNEVDCVSTHLLREWLVLLKPENIDWYISDQDNLLIESPMRKEWEIEYEKYQQRLEGNDAHKNHSVAEHLSDLLEFHNREAKPQWWSMFERQNKFDDELIDDTECLAGLKLAGVPVPEKRSLIYSYEFPPQEYKLKRNSQVLDVSSLDKAGTIVSIDEDHYIVQIKRSATQDPLPETLSLGPSGPVNTKSVRKALYRFADHILNQSTPHVAHEIIARNILGLKAKNKANQLLFLMIYKMKRLRLF